MLTWNILRSHNSEAAVFFHMVHFNAYFVITTWCVWTQSPSKHSSQMSWLEKDGKMQNFKTEEVNQRKSTILHIQVKY